VAEIIRHVYHKEGKTHIHHSYLVDVGYEIEIQQVLEYKWKVFDSLVLSPPHPKTRFFEIALQEYRNDGISSVEDLEVCPVMAEKKPDLKFLGFVLRKGPWQITEWIHKKANNTETVWIYTDDFHIFAITHAQDSPEAMVSQVTTKIEEIARSIKNGYRVYSHMENQQKRREAFDAAVEGESGITINKTAILKHPEYQLIAQLNGDESGRMQEAILQDLIALGATMDMCGGKNPSGLKTVIPGDRDITPEMTRIAELEDLSWLYE